MNEFWAVIYGMIQGLTEFLPISSSGHLALVPKFAGFSDPGLVFDLAMHLGTALAVIIYFYKDIARLVINSINLFIPSRVCDSYTKNFIIATAATGVFALLLKDFAQLNGRHSFLIAANLALFGIFLYLADKWGDVNDKMMDKSSSWKKALIIGLLQVLAIFPGVSRSGITITGARILGLSKHESSSFSFLLSLPLIFAGVLLKSLELSKTGAHFDMGSCLIGVIVSFVVGLTTIHFFFKLLKKIKFSYFMYYRIALGLIVLVYLS